MHACLVGLTLPFFLSLLSSLIERDVCSLFSFQIEGESGVDGLRYYLTSGVISIKATWCSWRFLWVLFVNQSLEMMQQVEEGMQQSKLERWFKTLHSMIFYHLLSIGIGMKWSEHHFASSSKREERVVHRDLYLSVRLPEISSCACWWCTILTLYTFMILSWSL